jgi:rhamnogalacturonyl hydrolase YesR
MITSMMLQRISFVAGICILFFQVPACAQQQAKLQVDAAYAGRAEQFFDKVWNYYRVPKHGLFSEYYPQQHNDTLTYMQEGSVKSKEVSYLWPFSGLFASTSFLMQLPGKKAKYQPYMDSLVMAIEKYRDTTRSPAAYQAYPSFLEKVDRYYDDNGLVGIDYLQAYEADPNPAYLARAKDAFDFILSGWSDKLGGGVTWLEGHGDQKPACSNGMATLVALKLYKATGDKGYLDWGKRFYQWMYDNLRDSAGLYINDRKTADGSLNKTYWTYNSGSMLEASVLMYQFTKEQKYLAEARTIAAASYSFFGKKQPNNLVSVLDLPWFVLVLFRGYEALYKEDGNPRYLQCIIDNVDYAWQNTRDKHGLVYNNWNGVTDEKNTPKWLLDEACMIEFYARISLLKRDLQ